MNWVLNKSMENTQPWVDITWSAYKNNSTLKNENGGGTWKRMSVKRREYMIDDANFLLIDIGMLLFA